MFPVLSIIAADANARLLELRMAQAPTGEAWTQIWATYCHTQRLLAEELDRIRTWLVTPGCGYRALAFHDLYAGEESGAYQIWQEIDDELVMARLLFSRGLDRSRQARRTRLGHIAWAYLRDDSNLLTDSLGSNTLGSRGEELH